MLRIDASALDYTIIGLYFVTVIGIGVAARRLVKTDLDFFLLEDEDDVTPDERPALAQP